MRWPIQRGHFLVGANLPWLSYGGDFGANRWHPRGGVGRAGPRETLRRTFDALADGRVEVVRWFLLADGRAGLRESLAGGVVGLDDYVFRDVDAALEELGRAGLKAIFVLFDFYWFRRTRVVDGVRTGGRGSLAVDPVLRCRLIETVVDPLLGRYGHHPSIAAWDIVNEPEWVTRGTRMPPRPSDVPREAMRAFIRDIVSHIHLRTSHAATVGSASIRTLSLVEGLGLDVYQAHWYDRLARKAPFDRPVADLGLDRPLVLGEFPTRGSRLTPAEILNAARRVGYAGALAWSAAADDEASDRDALAAALAAFADDAHTRGGRA